MSDPWAEAAPAEGGDDAPSDDDAPPSYDSLFGPPGSAKAATGKALLGAATGRKRLSQMTAADVRSDKVGSHTNAWSRKSVRGKHIFSDEAMPDDGDVVALFDIDHSLFWCVENESTLVGGATVKLKQQGKHLSNGCLFTIKRIQKTNKEIHSAYRGREYQCLALQSCSNGKWIAPNFRGRIHCDAQAETDKCWLSVERIVATRMRRKKMTQIHPVRFYCHRAEGGIGQWVTYYESSIHKNPRLAFGGPYSKTDQASLFEVVTIRKAGATQATQI